ncbi:DgyrCDS2481 [Dimorphilus gyrociliatus]|uniref:DgyrCDS2481 n=1 Tax=Dimorphilus gyrociliatus TaxID=2664684 RepID=A0A7I8VDG6_9ANNE|nr:DgyrCDS2481 [Dimorphilus gyrociliatus]
MGTIDEINKVKVDIVRRMKYPRKRYLIQNSPPTEEEYELALESVDLCWEAFLNYKNKNDLIKFLKHNFEMFYELSLRRTALIDNSTDQFKIRQMKNIARYYIIKNHGTVTRPSFDFIGPLKVCGVHRDVKYCYEWCKILQEIGDDCFKFSLIGDSRKAYFYGCVFLKSTVAKIYGENEKYKPILTQIALKLLDVEFQCYLDDKSFDLWESRLTTAYMIVPDIKRMDQSFSHLYLRLAEIWRDGNQINMALRCIELAEDRQNEEVFEGKRSQLDQNVLTLKRELQDMWMSRQKGDGNEIIDNYYLKEASTYLSCTELCFDSAEDSENFETNQKIRYIWKKEAAELCWLEWLEINSTYFDNEIREHLSTIISDFIRVTIKRQKHKEDRYLIMTAATAICRLGLINCVSRNIVKDIETLFDKCNIPPTENDLFKIATICKFLGNECYRYDNRLTNSIKAFNSGTELLDLLKKKFGSSAAQDRKVRQLAVHLRRNKALAQLKLAKEEPDYYCDVALKSAQEALYLSPPADIEGMTFYVIAKIYKEKNEILKALSYALDAKQCEVLSIQEGMKTRIDPSIDQLERELSMKFSEI